MARSTAGKSSLISIGSKFVNKDENTVVCKQCGSLVDNAYKEEHTNMHKYFVEVVEALENHKKEINKVKDAFRGLTTFTI